MQRNFIESKLAGHRGASGIFNGIRAVEISADIPEDDKLRLKNYIKEIMEAMAGGYEPAIIQVYDKKEAKALVSLRDKRRRER